MITFKDFDWSVTKKELILLIPNFGRGKYIRKTIDILLNTKIPSDKWAILIINDAIHEDFSDLENKNIYYFTFERSPIWERGDAFMRNIAIKYCQCNMLAQKDPEIFYTGDFIKGCFDHKDILYRCGGTICATKELETIKFLNNNIGIEELLKSSDKNRITEYFVCWHFGHCAPIKCFKDLGGYDEDFKTYGYVDTDMHDRLMKSGLKQYIDNTCSPIHLWHPKPNVYNDENDKKEYEEMRKLYNNKQNSSIIRNIGVDWGEGDPNYVPAGKSI